MKLEFIEYETGKKNWMIKDHCSVLCVAKVLIFDNKWKVILHRNLLGILCLRIKFPCCWKKNVLAHLFTNFSIYYRTFFLMCFMNNVRAHKYSCLMWNFNWTTRACMRKNYVHPLLLPIFFIGFHNHLSVNKYVITQIKSGQKQGEKIGNHLAANLYKICRPNPKLNWLIIQLLEWHIAGWERRQQWNENIWIKCAMSSPLLAMQINSNWHLIWWHTWVWSKVNDTDFDFLIFLLRNWSVWPYNLWSSNICLFLVLHHLARALYATNKRFFTLLIRYSLPVRWKP